MSTISRTVLREQVKDILLQRIVSGELKPGERLVETRIATGARDEPGARARGAARPRAAAARRVGAVPRRARPRLRRGRADRGLPRPRRRSRSSRRRWRRSSSTATSRRSRSSSRRCARRRARGDMNGLVEHDIAFHRLIVEAAGNAVLEQCWKSLGVEGRITISLYGTYVEPHEAAELHVPILEAIRSGPPAAAGREARKHVEAFARIAREPASRARRAPVAERARHRPRPRRALPGRAGPAAADRRRRAADPADPGRARHLARGRRAARHDPGALHGAVRAGRRVPRARGSGRGAR